MPSPESERKLCLFRQMEAGDPENPPDDIERALNAPDEFACKVGGCAIKGHHLIDYAFAAGRALPRESIDSIVAPLCLILGIPTPLDRFRSTVINEIGIDPLDIDGLDPRRNPPSA